MRRLLTLATACAVGLGFAACGGSDTDTSTATPAAAQTPPPAAAQTPPPAATGEQVKVGNVTVTNAEETGSKPEIVVDPDAKPVEKFTSRDLVTGKGPAIGDGDMATVHYVGVSSSTGEEFDSSWDRGEPFEFPVGGGQVIEGWDRGVAGMKPGGRRLLILPAELGYGEEGSPPAIAPGETLVFVIDAVPAG